MGRDMRLWLRRGVLIANCVLVNLLPRLGSQPLGSGLGKSDRVRHERIVTFPSICRRAK